MYEIGRLCVKVAGRDAKKKCVIVDILDHNFVLIDGETRRRKCNVYHLEPLDKVLKIKKGASHSEVAEIFGKEGFSVKETSPKQKADKILINHKTFIGIKPTKKAPLFWVRWSNWLCLL